MLFATYAPPRPKVSPTNNRHPPPYPRTFTTLPLTIAKPSPTLIVPRLASSHKASVMPTGEVRSEVRTKMASR